MPIIRVEQGAVGQFLAATLMMTGQQRQARFIARRDNVALSKVQQGVIGQLEAAKLMMMGSGGKLEVAAPYSDDERRDQEIHARGQFGKAMALQMKTTMRLVRQGRTYRISFVSNVRRERIISHPLFWYLFAYLDPKTMAFGDPMFLVPSAAVHASLKRRQGQTYLAFHASMGPKTHDQWVQYRVHPAELGKRVLQVLNTRGRLPKAELLTIPALGSDIIWVGTHRGPR